MTAYEKKIIMENGTRHEIVSSNYDVDVRFYLSVDEGSYVAPHWHNSLEIIYMLEGSMKVKCENKEMDVQAGDISLINSREIHSFWSTPNKSLVLQVPEKLLEKYISDYELVKFHVNPHPGKETENTKLEWLKKVCYDMYVIYEVRPEGYLFKFKSLLYDLLYMLFHSYSVKMIEKEVNRNNKNREQIKQILRYLDRNHARQITVQETAEEFGYNPDYLSRMLKQQIGLTTMEYLYEVRMNYVYQDLMNTEDYVSEIFTRHGCTNYKVAMRWFKRRYHYTPSQLRRQRLDKMEVVVNTEKYVIK